MIRCSNLPDALVRLPETASFEGKDKLKEVERDMIVKALERHRGNRRLAAEQLQMSRRTLQYKLKEFGLLDEQ
jgi:DNA-binding NtrC family response regulator